MGPPFKTPLVDEADYRLINLDNRLQAVLVHDPKADKAAAAVDVRVGSLSDPEDVPGLAHFLEHMLFYSSERYPEEDSYSKFIAERGGSTNAYTASESTNYYFSVNADALPEALDRFAQFFIGPRISPDGVQREVQAVDSEHSKNVNSDPWKKLQLWKATANPAHPFSHFATGNLDTLLTRPKAAGGEPHQLVRRFWQEHYDSGLMRLAVVGPQPLEELEGLVRERFGGVEDRGLQPPSFDGEAVTAAQCGQLLRMVPERDGHSVELQWPTPPEQPLYQAAPSHYVSHLLGHEGEGSAFALLRARGWASSLVAGEAGTSYSGRSFFMCRVELTQEGQVHVAEVIGVIFAYLALLRAPGGVSESVWQEMAALSRLKFDFRDQPQPASYASSLAQGMQVYAPGDLLEALHGVPLRYDPALIAHVIEALTPERARVMWASKELAEECDLREEWYGTPYALSSLPQAWVQGWREAAEQVVEGLRLPDPNPFVPSDFSLLPEAAPAPVVVHSTPMTRLWLRPEPSFKVPKAAVYLHWHLPEAYASPQAAVLTQLFARLVNDALSEVTYPADVAGLHYGLRSTTCGLLLSLSGYHHTLPRLADVVFQATQAYAPAPDRFQVIKEKVAKDYANMKFDQPYQLALYTLSVMTEVPRWHVADYEAVLGALGPDDLQAFLPRLLSRCNVEAYAAGNLPQSAAVDLAARVEAGLRERCGAVPAFHSQAAAPRVVKLAPGRPALHTSPGPNPSNENSAVVVAFQVGPSSPGSNALGELVAHIGKRDAFYQLRTVEQLGYITFFSTYHTLTVHNIAFIIQSSTKGAAHLEQRVAAFLPQLAARLADLSPSEFAGHVEELAKSKLERPKRLREAAAKDWREIDDGTLLFGREEVEVAALRALTQADLLQFFNAVVMDPATRRKVSVQVQGCTGAEGEQKGIGAAAVEEEGKSDRQAAEAVPDEAEAVPAEAASTGTIQEEDGQVEVEVEVVKCIYAWKRRQELYPSTR